MKLKTLTATIGLALALITIAPLSAFASTTHKMAAAATVYVCSKCHMKFSAADAKKDHYKDPMDGGTLVAVKSGSVKAGTHKPSSSMSSMGM
jgi:hypothetical protein